MGKKGRGTALKHTLRKLTDEQVRDIRGGKLTGNEYARTYKVDRTTIFRVIKNLTYKYIE